MRKTITAIYFALLGVGCVLMLCCIFTADTTVTDTRKLHGESELAPYEVKQRDDNVREFYLRVDEVTDTGTCLSFYTNHANVYVYENDALVYSVEATRSIFGTTPGARWNYVELEYGTTDIMVRVEAAYPQVRDYEISFVVGNSYNMALDSIRSSVWEIVVSVLDLFVGAVLIVYGVMTRRRKLNVGEGVLGLGVFSLMMGTWSFLEAEITSILVTNRVAASFLRLYAADADDRAIYSFFTGIPRGKRKTFCKSDLCGIADQLCCVHGAASDGHPGVQRDGGRNPYSDV